MAHHHSNQHKSFESRAERAREEALCSHYRGIGIPAVAAAKCVRGEKPPKPPARPIKSDWHPDDE